MDTIEIMVFSIELKFLTVFCQNSNYIGAIIKLEQINWGKNKHLHETKMSVVNTK